MSKALKKERLLQRVWQVMCVAFLIGGQAFAQDTALDRLFTIRDIEVDETASSARRAREVALSKVETIAYEKILRKLTQPEGRQRLPELDAQRIQSLISGIEVVNEQSSSRRYLATLNVRFEPGLMSDFLAQYNVPHVLGTGRGILVLHAHQRGLDSFLWEQDAAVMSARSSVDWVNRIRTYVFPNGYVPERTAVTVDQVKRLGFPDMSDLADTYGVRSVLEISSRWDGNTQSLTFRYGANEDQPVREGSLKAASEEMALTRMYETILETIDSDWRARLLVDTGTGGEMSVSVPTHTLENYVTITRKLQDISLIEFLEIDKVAVPTSQLRFGYTGREDQLVLALRFAGLDLVTRDDGTAILSLRPE